MNETNVKKDLRDQTRYLEKLVERLVTGMRQVRAPAETDRYADCLRDLISFIRMDIAMKEDMRLIQVQMNSLREFITQKIQVYEDEWRRADEGLANLSTPHAVVRGVFNPKTMKS